VVETKEFQEALSMIEPIMYAGIGFLVAGLLVLGVIPLVHARAVRLTIKRVEAATPMSMGEIQADKDQLRAEFAMSTRRLEMSVEQMKAKTTSQLAEIGKKGESVSRLKLELGEKTTALLALEETEAQLTAELATTSQQLAAKTSALEDSERVLAEIQSELAKASSHLSASSLDADSQRIEVVSLRARVEMFKDRIDSYQKETTDLRTRLAQANTDLDAANRDLTEELSKTEVFHTHIEELERLLVAQTTEAEISGRRVQELTARLDEQGRYLAEHEFVAERLRGEAKTARQVEGDVRAELAEVEDRRRETTDSLRAERAALEEQLRQATEERARLEREIATMKREADSTWANERMENAVLRERINDVAAEVARLTSALEGPSSPIDAILASDAARMPGSNGNHGNSERLFVPPGAHGEGKGSLADRIRALQTRASRIGQAS
jgi:chromosome segregation ATPase